MRTGSAAAARPHGYSYLVVLFLVALTAAGLAALGRAWSTAAQRERERELAFRGSAIANAITSYQRAGTVVGPELPRSLDDLLEDRRGVTVRHHLRRRYADPFTGEADWELVPSQASSAAGFNAVRSRSGRALLREQAPDGSTLHKASDWLFTAPPLDGRLPAVPQPGASAASAAEPPR